MQAYLDAEFNSDVDNSNAREDYSLIEVAMIICDERRSNKIIDTYHTYVKPIKNNGRLYERIIELTGIQQEQVDSGKKFQSVIDDMKMYIEKYEIDNIFTFSSADAFAFRWNAKQYALIRNHKTVTKLFCDLSRKINKILELNEPSLLDLSVICECEPESAHNALSDAQLLRNIDIRVSSGKYNEDILELYKIYVMSRNVYYKFKMDVEKMQILGMDTELWLENAKKNQKFPVFSDYRKR